MNIVYIGIKLILTIHLYYLKICYNIYGFYMNGICVNS
jgi:hypothetical protein